MFKRKTKFERKLSKVGSRVAKIPVGDLPMWADQAINDTGRSLTAFLRRGDRADLEEAILGSEALATILTSIRDRT